VIDWSHFIRKGEPMSLEESWAAALLKQIRLRDA